ncbi:MAG: nucleotide exchange factor GrpE [Ignavibacteria bacterium]
MDQKDLKNEEIKINEESENENDVNEETTESGEKDDLLNRISELEKQNEGLNNTLLRKAAEFENYKRRNENDVQNLLKYASEPVIMKIIPVFDDLERSFNHLNKETSIESLKKGLELVHGKFSKVFEDLGIKKIETVGKEFDFNYHEALMQREAEDVPAHTVLEEIEPGYMYKDKVIKHAKVIVSQEVVSNDNTAEETKNNNDEEEKDN